MRFYIVDDNLAVAATAKALLEKAGHEATISPGGHEAMADIKAQVPECLILDIMMPELGGLEFCRVLRQDSRLDGMKIVILSGKANNLILDEAMARGANGALKKPINPATFVDQVMAALAG
jgi:CheY-like chemotaxis protein